MTHFVALVLGLTIGALLVSIAVVVAVTMIPATWWLP